MVELPQYVHRVKKTRAGNNLVVYTFFTKFRNTPQAWPSITLPEPLSADFVERLAICEAMERDEKGFLLGGKRLPALKDSTFWPEALLAYTAYIRRQRGDVKDFKALIDAFTDDANPAWVKLAKSTRVGYRHSADIIEEIWSSDLPSELTTVDAQEAIDALNDTPAAANQFRAFLSRLLAWGIPRGFCTTNVVEHTEKVPGGEPWKPWPEWAFEVLIKHAPFHLKMIAISGFFTGQREVDLIKMLRPKSTDKTMAVRAQKTGTTVWIPIHSEYRKWIDRIPGDTVMLHAGARATHYRTASGFRTEWQKLMATEPFKRFREERIVFHGLRKNSVINLLEVGCTEAQVGSICNMTPQMVTHYGKEVQLRKLANDAMKLMEDRWSEIAPAALKSL